MPTNFGLSVFAYNNLFPALLMLSGVLMVASIDIYLPAAPYLTKFFDTTEWTMQFGMMINPIIASLTGIFYGHWSDINGRKPAMIASLALFGFGSALMALSYNIESFLIFRLIQAFGAGGISVISISILSDMFSGSTYARYMATYSMCFPIMLAIAPVLGATLFQKFGWQSNFLFLAVVAFCLSIFFIIKLPETNKKHKESIKWNNIGKNIKKLFTDKNFMSLSIGHGMPVAMAAVYSVNSAFIFINGFQFSPDFYAYLQLIPVAFNLVGSIIFRHFVVQLGIPKSLKVSLLLNMIFIILCIVGVLFKDAQLPTPILITVSILNLTLSACISGCGTLALDYDNKQRGLAVAVLGLFRNGVVALITLFIGFFFNGTIIPVYIGMIFITIIMVYAIWPYALGGKR